LKALIGVAMLAACVLAPLSTQPVSAQSTTPSNVFTWYGESSQTSSLPVAGIPLATQLIQAADYGGLALSSGNVYSWISSTDPKASEEKGPTQIVAVGEGASWGAGVTKSGGLWGWGNDTYGELCNGEVTEKTVAPELARGVQNIVAVQGGGNHSLLLTSAGTVEACGIGSDGQLGDGNDKNSDVPVNVRGLKHIVQISAGSQDSMALDSSGHVWMWGLNNLGQLGDDSMVNSDVPVELKLPPVRAVQISAGGDCQCDGHEMALLSDGQVWTWGDDSLGQLGNGETESYSLFPIQATALSEMRIQAVAAGGKVSYALDTSGAVWEFGGTVGIDPKKMDTGYYSISAVGDVFEGLKAGNLTG
jgi:alpha-tubulin suppressor-like RCC1 family protein